jgi:hypothetical protein
MGSPASKETSLAVTDRRSIWSSSSERSSEMACKRAAVLV